MPRAASSTSARQELAIATGHGDSLESDTSSGTTLSGEMSRGRFVTSAQPTNSIASPTLACFLSVRQNGRFDRAVELGRDFVELLRVREVVAVEQPSGVADCVAEQQARLESETSGSFVADP